MMSDHPSRWRYTAPMLVLLAAFTLAIAVQAWQRPVLRDEPVPPVTAGWPDRRIDINTAPEAELMLLPGIGPRLAERVVGNRERHGPFTSLEDLQRVHGIGPRTVEHIRPRVAPIVTGDARAPAAP